MSQVKWTPDLLQVLARGDPKRGQTQAIEVCAPCHGDKGTSADAQFPHMNGQSGAAIYKQLHGFRSGSRVNEQMSPIAQGLDEKCAGRCRRLFRGAAEAQSAAEHARWSQYPHLATDRARRSDARAAGIHGLSSRRLGGPIETPMLYGRARRRNDVYARMRTIAAKLTPEQIEGLARYYASGLR